VTDLPAALADLLDVGAVDGLRRLSGGASRETWSFDAAGRPLILQKQRPGAGESSVNMGVEVALLRAAAGAGVPVPAVVADASDGSALGAAGFVVERVEGESIARKLLRDPEFDAVRPLLARQCGRILAGVHRIPSAAVEGLPTTDPVDSMRRALDGIGEPHPAFELGFRWLDAHCPAAGATGVVHGDFRTGNLLITPDGVSAVLDWELAHLGEPLEDLGWFCVRAWRFGNDDHPAGGFGSREELWAGYEEAGGAPVDPEAARWWEVFGTLKWGVICVMQGATHWLGLSRSMELAAIGRRASENEHDLLALLAPDREPPHGTAIEGEPVGGLSPSDRPTAAELAEAVREWLEGDVLAGTEGRLKFHARVAANVLAMLEREVRLGASHLDAMRRRHERLGSVDEASLAASIRNGSMDDRWDDVVEAVWATVVDKLAVAHPGYDQGRP
jgi:aminoglycoside phosphotransferase (APT) family kinase protein